MITTPKNIEGYRGINELSLKFLERDYLLPGQSIDDRVKLIMDRFEFLIQSSDLRKEFEDYFRKGYYSLSTPIWTNYGTRRGLPISCFGTFISDSMESILYAVGEIGMMSKYGGGTSAKIEVRERGSAIKDNGISAGPFGFESLYDKLSSVVSQGSTRRGSLVMYMDIFHPDILEHLAIREDNNPIQDLSFAVCVPNWWMEEMINGDAEKRKIWARVIEVRNNTGYPYIFFTDTVNDNTAEVYKKWNMKIKASNLCSEIALPSSDEESFICCLASMNVLYFDEWKHTRAVQLLTMFLDTVITDFIETLTFFINKLKESHTSATPYVSFMERPLRFAERHRAIGVGVLGLASLYQSKMLPFESIEASQLNIEVFKFIHEKTNEASIELASKFGEPELLVGEGRRNTCLQAVAPTKSSSFIHGQVSEGIEPWRTNSYIKDLAKIKHAVKNPYLEQLLEDKGLNTYAVWSRIDADGGSVQKLEFLNDNEKAVFKTFQEINPRVIIQQAAARQQYIDQSQSLNLMIDPKQVSIKDINALMIEAWELGVKTLYYQHGVNAAQEFAREFMSCSSCEA